MTGHLFCKRAALALMALFAALAMTLLPADGGKVSHAQTPTTVTLVSNTGQSQDTSSNISGDRHSQRFTTGSHQWGYTITSIDIIIRSSPAGPTSVAMTLHSGSATGTEVADFTGPSSLTDDLLTYTFTPTAALSLGASTRYWIVLNQTTNMRIARTEEDSEDAGSAEGWQIQKLGFYSTMIGVKGYENLPPPPTSTDSAVTTSKDMAHTFTAANFNFMPATTEDTLTKVHIVTLPNRGTLALSGTAVTAGQEITKADIDAGNLKFTPVADEFGDPYTSFLFRVEGSSRTSTATYTMTIDVTAVTTIFVSNTGQGSQEGQSLNDGTDPVGRSHSPPDTTRPAISSARSRSSPRTQRATRSPCKYVKRTPPRALCYPVRRSPHPTPLRREPWLSPLRSAILSTPTPPIRSQ